MPPRTKSSRDSIPKSSRPSSSKSSRPSSKSIKPSSSKSSKPSPSKSTRPSSSRSSTKLPTSKSSKLPTAKSSKQALTKSTVPSPTNSSKPRPSSKSSTPSPSALNRLSHPTAHTVFHAVCAAPTYISLMESSRPYRSLDHLLSTSRASWNRLSDREWRSAFRAHIPASRTPPDTNLMSSWIRRENATVRHAAADVRRGIRELEMRYESKHGFPFVCFLGGKSVEGVKKELRERVGNETEVEMYEAAGELVRIMEDRLERALNEARSM